jgi:Holliday junction DNA helicase RuvB
MSAPLRDRFGLVHRLNFYTPLELETIITNAAKKLKVKVDKESIKEIAKRARGTPRIALKLLKRARDYAQVRARGDIDKVNIVSALDLLGVDPFGLDELDRKYLKNIIEKHEGGPVGVETIAASIAEDIGTVEEVVEPYLLQLGFIKRTKSGRVATKSAYEHLGKKFKDDKPQQKFI